MQKSFVFGKVLLFFPMAAFAFGVMAKNLLPFKMTKIYT